MAKIKKVWFRPWVIPAHILHNSDLSMKAKGIYVWLQQKQDNYAFSVESIVQYSKDGKASINQWMKELEDLWLLVRTKFKNELGQWDVEYEIFEDINHSQKSATEQKSGNSDWEKEKQNSSRVRKLDMEPCPIYRDGKSANNIVYNNIYYNYINNILHSWDLKISEKTKEKISEFISYRKEKKSKLTERSILAIIKKAEQYGEEKTIATIDRSIENGWQGLFWEKTEKSGNFFRKSARNALTEEKDYSTNRFAVWST